MQSTYECWLPVRGYEGFYEVSNFGAVRSVGREIKRTNGRRYKSTGKLISQKISASGYKIVCLSVRGNKSYKRVHRLVLEAFVGPCPDGMEACHWDDDPANNGLVNLRWDYRSGNRRDGVRNGKHANAIKTHCPQRHEYLPENTLIVKGERRCRACARENAKRNYARSRRK